MKPNLKVFLIGCLIGLAIFLWGCCIPRSIASDIRETIAHPEWKYLTASSLHLLELNGFKLQQINKEYNWWLGLKQI